MDNSRSTLDRFSSTETDLDPDAVSVARCANLTSVPKHRDGPVWEAPDDEWGLQTRRPTAPIRTAAGRASPQQVRWVVDGAVGAYVDEYGDGEVWGIPETYDGFCQIDTYVAHVDGRAAEYGYGIDGQALERAFRVLTGGGRYSGTQYSVFPCGRQPWVLTGPEGTLLCSCQPVSRPTDECERRTREISPVEQAFEIEEENPQVLAGVSHFVTLLADACGIEILDAEYDTFRGTTRHSFHGRETECEISATALATLGCLATDPADLPVRTEATVSPPGSTRECDVEWEGPSHAVGSIVDEAIIAGYEFAWEQPDDALERVATVRSYRLTSTASRYRLTYRSDRLATLVPDSVTSHAE